MVCEIICAMPDGRQIEGRRQTVVGKARAAQAAHVAAAREKIREVPAKTELCMYVRGGVCRYGDRCIFAHSLYELEEWRKSSPSGSPFSQDKPSPPRCTRESVSAPVARKRPASPMARHGKRGREATDCRVPPQPPPLTRRHTEGNDGSGAPVAKRPVAKSSLRKSGALPELERRPRGQQQRQPLVLPLPSTGLPHLPEPSAASPQPRHGGEGLPAKKGRWGGMKTQQLQQSFRGQQTLGAQQLALSAPSSRRPPSQPRNDGGVTLDDSFPHRATASVAAPRRLPPAPLLPDHEVHDLTIGEEARTSSQRRKSRSASLQLSSWASIEWVESSPQTEVARITPSSASSSDSLGRPRSKLRPQAPLPEGRSGRGEGSGRIGGSGEARKHAPRPSLELRPEPEPEAKACRLELRHVPKPLRKHSGRMMLQITRRVLQHVSGYAPDQVCASTAHVLDGDMVRMDLHPPELGPECVRFFNGLELADGVIKARLLKT